VPKHQDLELLRALRFAQQHDQLNETTKCQIYERPDHDNLPESGTPKLIDVRADAALRPRTGFLNPTGNDLLGGALPRAILGRLHQIAQRIQPLGARVVVNTVYDPSDGDNDVGRHELGLSRLATIDLRRRLNAVNGGIGKLAVEHGFLLADLERLFHGHGVASNEPWFVQVIEPNLAGATAIAEHWHELLTSLAQVRTVTSEQMEEERHFNRCAASMSVTPRGARSPAGSRAAVGAGARTLQPIAHRDLALVSVTRSFRLFRRYGAPELIARRVRGL
jgi:hypothetical protein